MPILNSEKEVWTHYAQVIATRIAETKELFELRAKPESDEINKRIIEITNNEKEARKAFAELLGKPEVKAALKAMASDQDYESIDLPMLERIGDQVRENEVLLYPLILEDRLELVFVTHLLVPQVVSVPVSRTELSEAALEFRLALRRGDSSAEEWAQKFYQWLFEPFDIALDQFEDGQAPSIDTIVYVPDDFLRYIPLSALRDENDWLVRRFAVSTISSSSIAYIDRPQSSLDRVIAGAFTVDQTIVDPSGKTVVFSGLPHAEREVNDLKDLFPGAKVFVGSDFKKDNFEPFFENYQIVHLATHGVFTPGRPEEFSYILFGDGKYATLDEVDLSWSMRRVDMVVLSACETGIGGTLGNGREIHGFGYLIQAAGANASLASLWKVSDSATHALMSTFYKALKSTNKTKTQALQIAQLALLDGELDSELEQEIRAAYPDEIDESSGFSHPFNWASFYIIGNNQ